MTSRRAEGGRKGNGGKRRRTEAAAKTTLTEIMAHLQQIYIYYIYTLYCVVRKEQKRVQHLNFAAAARSNKLWQRQYQRGRQKGSGKQEGGGGKRRGTLSQQTVPHLHCLPPSGSYKTIMKDNQLCLIVVATAAAVVAVAAAAAVAVEVCRVIDDGCGRA